MCAVKGCQDAAESVIDAAFIPRLDVCRFHQLALSMGEAFAVGDGDLTISLGTQADR